MRATRIGLAVVLALTAQTTLARLFAGGAPQVDLVLVVVVSAALASGSRAGLWTGTIAGLLQDILSGGIVGVSGLAKSLVGFVVGIVGAQFIVSGMGHRAVIFVVATVAHAFIFVGVYALVASVGPLASMTGILTQAAANAVIGIAAGAAIQMTPGLLDRARLRRTTFSRRRWNVG